MRFGLAILALFLVLFLSGAWHGISSCINAFSRQKWPTVKADVVQASFDVERTTNDLGKIYIVKAHYTFSIDGKDYESKSVADRKNFTATEREVLQAFGSHSSRNVTVRYNPNDPSESFIYVSSPWKYAALAFMCVLFSLMSIIIYYRLDSTEATS